jgi:putative transcriptional regulator
MMLLHSCKTEQQQLLTVADGIFLGGDVQFLHELIEDETSPNVFLCFGYAGWASGQLEREFLDGSWYLCKATKGLVFDTPPADLWKTLLRQMGGRYATLSTIPEDPSVN